MSSPPLPSSYRLVYLSGPWRLLDHNQRAVQLSPKHMAFCFFLLLNGPQERSQLHQLFFGGTTRANLRMFLSELRQLGLIRAEQHRVSLFALASDILDVQQALLEQNTEWIRGLCLAPIERGFLYDLPGLSDEVLLWFEEYFTDLYRRVFAARMELAESVFEQGNEHLLRLYLQEALAYAQELGLDVSLEADQAIGLLRRLYCLLHAINAIEAESFEKLLQQADLDEVLGSPRPSPLVLLPSLTLRRKSRLELTEGVWQALDHETVDTGCDFLLHHARTAILTNGSGKSLDIIHLSRALTRQINCPIIQGRLFNVQGLAYKKLHMLYESRSYFEQAVRMFKGLTAANEIYLPSAVTNLGLAYGLLDDTLSAFKLLREGVALRERQDDLAAQANGYGLMASILTQQGDDQTALDVLARADQLYQQIDGENPYLEHFLAFRWLNKAILQLRQGDFEQARTLIGQAGGIFEKNGEIEGQMEVALLSYELSKKSAQFEQAQREYQKVRRYEAIYGLSAEMARKAYRLEPLQEPVESGPKA